MESQREMKKILERFDKKERIRLITELAKFKKYNRQWLEIEFEGPTGLEILVNRTEDAGWGYHDVLWDRYNEHIRKGGIKYECL